MMQTEILFEDKDILVCYKPAGIATQTSGFAAMDVVSELKNYLSAKGQADPFVGVIQRLDQPVEGVLVFGKNKKATAALNKQLTQNEIKKEYLAAVFVKTEDKPADAFWKEKDAYPLHSKTMLTDYLVKDARTNTSYVVEKPASLANEKVDSNTADSGKNFKIQKTSNAKKVSENPDAKKAELTYTILQKEKVEGGMILYVRIFLHTGRHHQIRVQFAHANMPLLGDRKYGTEASQKISDELSVRDVALCAQTLRFKHPVTSRKQEFSVKPHKPILQKITE